MGPIAPKDPVKKRDFYYIMIEKQICCYPAPEGLAPKGKGVTIIYQNDDRMLSSSRIIGNIRDEEMLKLLRTTQGFRKLIYAIGVSMMSDQCDEADFVFQMYGKTDPYKTGTVIRQKITADGVEYVIPLHEVEWSEDDKEPGQIRFEFEKPGIMSNVSVRYYLNDGFTAPPFEGIDKVDLASKAYTEMIGKSVISLGENDRIKRVIKEAREGKQITYAFIGGSITQGAGATPINTACYTYRAYTDFKNKYCKTEPVYIKAGVGGTPSEYGMVRFDRDVLSDGKYSPDIVVIEFAVNDSGDETNGECYEGLVRKALNLPGKPAVILIFSVFADDYNLEERLIPIGNNYKIPMVSCKRAVTDQFYLSKDEGRVISKAGYFYDCYHPTNLGHTIMADAIGTVIDQIDKANAESFKDIDYRDYPACMSSDFENITLIDKADNSLIKELSEGSFNGTDKALQCVERNLDMFTTPQMPNNWYHTEGSESFKITLEAKRILIITKDSHDPKTGKADIFVDSKLVKTVDPREIGWIHCNPQIIYRSDVTASHVVEVKMHEGDENKEFTILGFAIVK